MGLDPTVSVALITVIGGGLISLLALLIQRIDKLRVATKGLKDDNADLKLDTAATRHNVQNDHKTNMRGDIDKVILGVNMLIEGQKRHDEIFADQNERLAEHTRALGTIHIDQGTERTERIALSGRVDKLYDRPVPAA